MREMDANAKIKSVALTAVQPATSSSAGGGFADSRAAQEAERAHRYRLVIEPTGSAGAYVYKTLDRLTGEVVQQLPREAVVKLSQKAGYAAGGVINTRV